MSKVCTFFPLEKWNTTIQGPPQTHIYLLHSIQKIKVQTSGATNFFISTPISKIWPQQSNKLILQTIISKKKMTEEMWRLPE